MSEARADKELESAMRVGEIRARNVRSVPWNAEDVDDALIAKTADIDDLLAALDEPCSDCALLEKHLASYRSEIDTIVSHLDNAREPEGYSVIAVEERVQRVVSRLNNAESELDTLRAEHERALAELASKADQLDSLLRDELAERQTLLRERNSEMTSLRAEREQSAIEITAVLESLGSSAVRVHESGGPEDLYASLAVSVAKLCAERDAVTEKVVAYMNQFQAADVRADGTLSAIIQGLQEGKHLKVAGDDAQACGNASAAIPLSPQGEHRPPKLRAGRHLEGEGKS